jgi:hypothetical protein
LLKESLLCCSHRGDNCSLRLVLPTPGGFATERI